MQIHLFWKLQEMVGQGCSWEAERALDEQLHEALHVDRYVAFKELLGEREWEPHPHGSDRCEASTICSQFHWWLDTARKCFEFA